MNKTIESIIMGVALATILGCESSSKSGSTGSSSCTSQSDEYTKCNRSETNCRTYSKSGECAKNGGSYSCHEVYNDRNSTSHCACSCDYAKDPNNPPDKGW